jgi:hypothetical protein
MTQRVKRAERKRRQEENKFDCHYQKLQMLPDYIVEAWESIDKRLEKYTEYGLNADQIAFCKKQMQELAGGEEVYKLAKKIVDNRPQKP